MRVLLTDGSGLTARQAATQLAAAGHRVEALAPSRLCLCGITRHVARVHRVPAYGPDPLGWLAAALAVHRSVGADVLLPTQEQVAVLALARDRGRLTDVATVVPSYAALAAVQDKRSAFATLHRLGVPQPPTATRVEGWSLFPAYVKAPIGTASGGVRRVTSVEELRGVAEGRPVVVQAAADGPLAMAQAVFDQGTLVAFHTCLRTAEGASGSASHKRSVVRPDVRHWLEVLGAELAWQGALSADVVLTGDGPRFIDVNPRLVEPANAWAAGVDLVGPMVELARGGHPDPQPPGRPDVATHQLLLAVLGAAQQGRGRSGVASELVSAWRRRGQYRDSSEELTPRSHDTRAAVPVLLAAAATLARPRAWSRFTSGSVDSYALTDRGWQQITAAATG